MARCFRPGRVPCKVRHEGLGQAEGAAPPTPVPESRFPSCQKGRCELVAGVCRQSFFRGEQKNESAQVAGALRWIGELRDGALIRVVGATVGPLPRLSASGGGRRRCQGSGGGTGLLKATRRDAVWTPGPTELHEVPAEARRGTGRFLS